MNKLVRDGLVAVIVSPGHGAGWYSWHGIEELLFDPSIVAWLEAQELDKIKSYVTLRYPGKYFGGLDNLTIKWVPVGSVFRIHEYDGSESISYRNMEDWIVA